MMPSQSQRRFVLADAMILIVATAIGTALVRTYLLDIMASMPRRGIWMPPNPRIRTQIAMRAVLLAGVPLLAVWTVALLLLRLRRPRPRLRRLFRQPGAIACAVVMLAVPLDAPWMVLIFNTGYWDTYNAANIIVNHVGGGYVVLGGWSTLALSGRWRAEPSWIDRAGRIIGVAWIVATVLSRWRYLMV